MILRGEDWKESEEEKRVVREIHEWNLWSPEIEKIQTPCMMPGESRLMRKTQSHQNFNLQN